MGFDFEALRRAGLSAAAETCTVCPYQKTRKTVEKEK